jgi:hypothetical protein
LKKRNYIKKNILFCLLDNLFVPPKKSKVQGVLFNCYLQPDGRTQLQVATPPHGMVHYDRGQSRLAVSTTQPTIGIQFDEYPN